MDRKLIGFYICVVILIAWVPVALAETVSEEAQRYMARGMAAVEMAETPKDYERAVREFEQAAQLAPNWPDVYFNLSSRYGVKSLFLTSGCYSGKNPFNGQTSPNPI